MRVWTSDRFGRWTGGFGLVALVALTWSVFVPGGVFWAAILAAGLVGSTVATALLVRSRRVPSLAQVIASAEAEAAVGVGAGGGKR
jgi:anti-sigma factor RsiW